MGSYDSIDSPPAPPAIPPDKIILPDEPETEESAALERASVIVANATSAYRDAARGTTHPFAATAIRPLARND
jgi:hypothetical protein